MESLKISWTGIRTEKHWEIIPLFSSDAFPIFIVHAMTPNAFAHMRIRKALEPLGSRAFLDTDAFRSPRTRT